MSKKERIPKCPKCGKNDKVVKTKDQHVLARMIIAKPLENWLCARCKCGF